MAIIDLMRLALVLPAVLAAALAAPARAETPIHFSLDRKIDGAAAPFFVAIDKGYFKAEGLVVTIDAASSPLDALQRLTESGGYDIVDLRVSETTLETVFINLTGKDLRE